jgi:hypothetical protein
LAEDIVEKGLNPSELVMVTHSDDPDLFVVLEGNRRVAALKLLSSPSLLSSLGLSSGLLKRYNLLHEREKDALPAHIDCVVLSRQDANYWIMLKHTGENEGVGVVSWDGGARQRFRGSSPALQALELVDSHDYLDEQTKAKLPKIAITNIERILGTPDARKLLGVDVTNDRLILKSPENQAIGRLATVVADVASRRVRVSDLDTKEQRVAYAQQVVSRPLPQPLSPKGMGKRGSTLAVPGSQPPHQAVRIAAQRWALIPRHLKLTIQQTRINKIYGELQKLNADQFVNSCAVLLRVFVELSVDDYAQRHRVSLKVSARHRKKGKSQAPLRDMTLREKLKVVADSLEAKGRCSRAELQGVRTLVSKRQHVLSVDTLNAYVHNKEYNPTPSDLRTTWDNIQVFIERLWTI